MDEPFTILQVHPRQEIPLSLITTIESLQLGSACVLVVIEKENSPNLLTSLEIEVAYNNLISYIVSLFLVAGGFGLSI